MTNYREISELLTTTLRLTVSPVSVCLSDVLPEGIQKAAGRVPAGCAFWERALTRTFATDAQDHELCAIGVYTHNLADPSETYERELGTVLNVLGQMQYVRPEDIPNIPVLKQKSKYVIYSPLEKTLSVPDVVLLFVNAAQSLIITEAVGQVDVGIAHALGRPACAIIPHVINRNVAAISLGCCGARAYLSIFSSEVALWGLPGNKIKQYVDRVDVLAKANAILGKFHTLRKEDVGQGYRPTYEESLARLQD